MSCAYLDLERRAELARQWKRLEKRKDEGANSEAERAETQFIIRVKNAVKNSYSCNNFSFVKLHNE